MIKRSGPSREPCGTPALTSSKLDYAPSTITHCFLFDKYEINRLRKFPSMPICESLATKPLCQTLSNAELMSRKTPCEILDWPHEDFIWWIM